MLVAAGYLYFIRKYTAPYASNADASGYLNHARLLLAGQDHFEVPAIVSADDHRWLATAQEPLGLVIDPATRTLAPTYPVGYPLHLVVGAWFVGLDWATVAVNVVLAGAAAGLMLALGRIVGLRWTWALAAVAVLWASPLFIYMSTQPMSDVAAMVWGLAAVVCAWRWRDGTAATTGAALSGIAFAVAVLVRPTNVLLLAPLALLLGKRPARWLAFGLAGLPGAVYLGWHNHALYGNVLASGYGDVSAFFSLSLAPATLAHFARGTALHLSPWVALSVLGLPWLRHVSGRDRALLVVWPAAFIALYACYSYSTGNWWYLRFILPGYPALIVGAMLVGQRVLAARQSVMARVAIPLVLLGATLTWQGVAANRHYATIMKRGERIYFDAAAWINAHTPAEAIVLAVQTSGALSYYTDRAIVRWDRLTPEAAQLLRETANREGRPLYAMSFGSEDTTARTGWSGPWRERASFGVIKIWELIP